MVLGAIKITLFFVGWFWVPLKLLYFCWVVLGAIKITLFFVGWFRVLLKLLYFLLDGFGCH